jgi:hypothetical protein
MVPAPGTRPKMGKRFSLIDKMIRLSTLDAA